MIVLGIVVTTTTTTRRLQSSVKTKQPRWERPCYCCKGRAANVRPSSSSWRPTPGLFFFLEKKIYIFSSFFLDWRWPLIAWSIVWRLDKYARPDSFTRHRPTLTTTAKPKKFRSPLFIDQDDDDTLISDFLVGQTQSISRYKWSIGLAIDLYSHFGLLSLLESSSS